MEKQFLIPERRALISGAAGLVAMGLVLYLSYQLSQGFPSHHLRPLFWAPAITSGVSVSIVFAYIFDEIMHVNEKCHLKANNVFVLSSFMLVFVVAILCANLAAAHDWASHLNYMLAIYFVFIIWDCVAMRCVNSRDIRKKIKTVHRSVNWPTLLSLFATYLFVFLNQDTAAWGIEVFVDASKPESQSVMAGCDTAVCEARKLNLPFGQFADAIVTGVVAFHLFTGALSYIFEEFLDIIKKNLFIVWNNLTNPS
ncbi:MAG: hypothetical protein ACFE0S_14460 [Rhodospirillales bacterium]